MKVEHNYFPQAAAAFIDYLDKLFEPFSDTLSDKKYPIAILNTGDEVFLSNKYIEHNKISKTFYNRVPRLSLDVKGFTIDTSDLTNRNVYGEITGKNDDGFDQSFVVPVRRIPIDWVFSVEAHFNNIIEFMKWVETYLTVSHHNHYFTFYYGDKLFNCTFFLQEDLESNANMMLQFDAEKRKRILPLTFVLRLQYPSLDIYPRGLHDNVVIPAGQTMIKLIHNIDVENCTSETVDHISTEITENDIKLI